ASDVIYAQTSDRTTKEIKDCSLYKDHVSDAQFTRISLDLFGGKLLSDFVPVSDFAFLVVSKKFADRLKMSGLTGYAIAAIVRIVCNQSEIPDPLLYYLDSTSNAGSVYQRWVVKGAPNLCPHCGKEPMVCPGCGKINWPRCFRCERLTMFRPDAPDYSDPKGF